MDAVTAVGQAAGGAAPPNNSDTSKFKISGRMLDNSPPKIALITNSFKKRFRERRLASRESQHWQYP
jgi:hypothetical protein